MAFVVTNGMLTAKTFLEFDLLDVGDALAVGVADEVGVDTGVVPPPDDPPPDDPLDEFALH